MSIHTNKFAPLTMTQASTQYTEAMVERSFRGQCAALVQVKVTSVAPSLTIYQQCSVDDINWYTPTDSAGTSVGEVVGSSTSTGAYRAWSVIIAPFIRFRCVENNAGAGVVTITLVFEE